MQERVLAGQDPTSVLIRSAHSSKERGTNGKFVALGDARSASTGVQDLFASIAESTFEGSKIIPSKIGAGTPDKHGMIRLSQDCPLRVLSDPDGNMLLPGASKIT